MFMMPSSCFHDNKLFYSFSLKVKVTSDKMRRSFSFYSDLTYFMWSNAVCVIPNIIPAIGNNFVGTEAEHPLLVILSTWSFIEINVFSDFVFDKNGKLISSIFRFKAIGCESAVRRGGKLNLPRVSRQLASGQAQVDLPEHPGWQQGAGKQL